MLPSLPSCLFSFFLPFLLTCLFSYLFDQKSLFETTFFILVVDIMLYRKKKEKERVENKILVPHVHVLTMSPYTTLRLQTPYCL